jgi:plasmid maintenance system antidote protein VapI
VQRLGSTNFAEREAAQRDLAASGQVVLPFLEDLDLARLDAEQAARIEKLITNLRVNYEDTADRVANWLIGDVSIWLSLAERPELAKREAARRQLLALMDKDVEFDPAADEATREDQLAKLRRRILPTPAAPRLTPDSSVPPPALER